LVANTLTEATNPADRNLQNPSGISSGTTTLLGFGSLLSKSALKKALFGTDADAMRDVLLRLGLSMLLSASNRTLIVKHKRLPIKERRDLDSFYI
jgi:hypothetical protein